MDYKTLIDLGFAESEIKVYFALLELEKSKVGPIIKKANVQDSKIYSILEKLQDKGLVSYVIKNNVKHFQASDPKNLINIINEKEKKLKSQKKKLKQKIIPLIEKRRRLTEDKQEATIYESYDGLKAAFNLVLEVLNEGEEYQVFMLDNILKNKQVINFFKNFHRKRLDNKIKVRLIADKKFRESFLLWEKFKNLKIKYVTQKLPIGIFIFKGYVMTIVWEEKPSAFVIKSKKNYEHYKEFFEEVWNQKFED